MRVSPGTQPDDTRTIGNRGVQKLSQPAGVRGDLNVIFKVVIPRASELTEQQREILERFRLLAHPNGSEAGFFKKTFGKLKETLCDDNEVSDSGKAKKQGEK